MPASQITWTTDGKDFKIARCGDIVVHMHRTRVNYGKGDRRNGYQWVASWKIAGSEVRKSVAGKREVAGIIRTLAN